MKVKRHVWDMSGVGVKVFGGGLPCGRKNEEDRRRVQSGVRSRRWSWSKDPRGKGMGRFS